MWMFLNVILTNTTLKFIVWVSNESVITNFGKNFLLDYTTVMTATDFLCVVKDTHNTNLVGNDIWILRNAATSQIILQELWKLKSSNMSEVDAINSFLRTNNSLVKNIKIFTPRDASKNINTSIDSNAMYKWVKGDNMCTAANIADPIIKQQKVTECLMNVQIL